MRWWKDVEDTCIRLDTSTKTVTNRNAKTISTKMRRNLSDIKLSLFKITCKWKLRSPCCSYQW